MVIVKQVIARCPICSGGELVISRLSCRACETRIETELSFPALMKLPGDLQGFVLVFLKCRGKIREVEKALGISYPTVCKRLELVNELLGQGTLGLKEGRLNEGEGNGSRGVEKRTEILGRVERGEMTAKEAAELLKGR